MASIMGMIYTVLAIIALVCATVLFYRWMEGRK